MVNVNWPTVIFEVCFNVDPFDPSPPAAVWTNLTSRVVAWSHQSPSGRQYELARTEAMALGVQVDNQDGALDPSNTGSTYWPNVVPFRQWRIKATWSATTYNLAFGYVERWPQRWDQHKAWVDAVVVDTLALLDPKTFRSCYDEEILADSPVGYYPLSEPAGAQSFGSIATTQQPNAPVVNSKYGAATVTAGEQAIVPTDPAACVSFAGANGGFAKIGSVVQLAAAGHGPYTVNQAGTGWSVELWFQAAAPVTDPGKLWSQVAANVGTGVFGNGAVRLNTNGTLVVSPVDSGGTTPTSPRYDDGKPHHVVFGFDTDGKAWKLYVDGALVISGANAAVFQSNSPGFGWVQVGGLLTSGA